MTKDSYDNSNYDDGALPPIPKRPLTAYNIFSILERQYILQSKQKSTLDPDQLPPDAVNDPYYSARPIKYRNVLLPLDWYVVGKNRKKRQDHQNHGVISFNSLSKMIATAWAEADEETKAFCKKVSADQLEVYYKDQKAYKEKYGEEAYDAQTRKRKNADVASELAGDNKKSNKQQSDGAQREDAAALPYQGNNASYAQGGESVPYAQAIDMDFRLMAQGILQGERERLASSLRGERGIQRDTSYIDETGLLEISRGTSAPERGSEVDRIRALLMNPNAQHHRQGGNALTNHLHTRESFQARAASQDELLRVMLARREQTRALLQTQDDSIRALLESRNRLRAESLRFESDSLSLFLNRDGRRREDDLRLILANHDSRFGTRSVSQDAWRDDPIGGNLQPIELRETRSEPPVQNLSPQRDNGLGSVLSTQGERLRAMLAQNERLRVMLASQGGTDESRESIRAELVASQSRTNAEEARLRDAMSAAQDVRLLGGRQAEPSLESLARDSLQSYRLNQHNGLQSLNGHTSPSCPPSESSRQPTASQTQHSKTKKSSSTPKKPKAPQAQPEAQKGDHSDCSADSSLSRRITPPE